ncbi:Chromosome (plasmid) partitioning protein ParA / Sporulation initiation inhibitor protein Soj [Methylophaga lonarensis MPL]|uniref:Chromosome (Plasmid) partitioning protein ParA / Sporulation initiation inhibitor protein Soj n=1 Tax=Methylophaga lonarensis MPL TaxID=1286106 RepID=M7P3W0_9GAMM|nr:AAA family ATPase [Methylophaga lonarensis]EMR14196.1 Chromosome (plasmid) partitioning protein ParA / Sporulation initiation inhibitor protein Soj [Methylophaga lonarensis MPL]MCC5796011.1 ParA family protein [Methylophaga sp.]
MGSIFAITNQKGGVGKTTTSVNLAAALADYGRKVLLIDLDPQGNASTGCGLDKDDIALTSYEVIMTEAKAADAIIRPDNLSFDVIPTNSDLTAAEVQLLEVKLREHRLRLALESTRDLYDYILIDCPPSLSMLTVNALVASKGVLIPIQCEYYALEGLSSLLKTIERIKQRANPGLEITGLLRTMFDARNNLANQVSRQLINHFQGKVFHSIIPRNVRLAEAPSHGLPVINYDRTSRGSIAYMALASELMRRDKKAA